MLDLPAEVVAAHAKRPAWSARGGTFGEPAPPVAVPGAPFDTASDRSGDLERSVRDTEAWVSSTEDLMLRLAVARDKLARLDDDAQGDDGVYETYKKMQDNAHVMRVKMAELTGDSVDWSALDASMASLNSDVRAYLETRTAELRETRAQLADLEAWFARVRGLVWGLASRMVEREDLPSAADPPGRPVRADPDTPPALAGGPRSGASEVRAACLEAMLAGPMAKIRGAAPAAGPAGPEAAKAARPKAMVACPKDDDCGGGLLSAYPPSSCAPWPIEDAYGAGLGNPSPLSKARANVSDDVYVGAGARTLSTTGSMFDPKPYLAFDEDPCGSKVEVPSMLLEKPWQKIQQHRKYVEKALPVVDRGGGAGVSAHDDFMASTGNNVTLFTTDPDTIARP